MPAPTSSQRSAFWALEELGRIRLSSSFYLRDFLHSEIAAAFALQNRPVDRELLVQNGRRLCETILEPLQATFGRIHIRSGYRSPDLNAFGNENGLKCARNSLTFADHIWDVRDAEGNAGACACIVIPWFEQTHGPSEWRRLAWWLYDHVEFHRVVFFSKQTAFNIGWRDNPKREISATIELKGMLVGPNKAPDPKRAGLYEGFPPFKGLRTPLSGRATERA